MKISKKMKIEDEIFIFKFRDNIYIFFCKFSLIENNK